jgi:hypothetical protein
MRADPVVGTIAVTREDDDGTWLIALHGEHDISTTPQVERQTRSIWPVCSTVIVDLSEAAFIDCTVINWLLRTGQELDATWHQALRVVDGPPAGLARRLVDILRLRNALACYPTRHDALAAQAFVPSMRRRPSPERGRAITDARPALRRFASSAS